MKAKFKSIFLLCLLILTSVPIRVFSANHAEQLRPVHEFEFGYKSRGPSGLMGPAGITVDSTGNIYICDLDNSRIKKFSKFGHLIWETAGKNSLFTEPWDIIISQSLYITDHVSSLIQVIDQDGNWLHTIEPEIGGKNLKNPSGLASDRSGFIFVTDSQNDRILKLDPSGKPIDQFGGFGPGLGRYNFPRDLEIYQDFIYILDTGNQRIQIMEKTGGVANSINLPTGLGQPAFLAISEAGIIAVSYPDSGTIAFFSADYCHLLNWRSEIESFSPFGLEFYNHQLYYTDRLRGKAGIINTLPVNTND